MEENTRYGFFDQIPVAFFQPSKYKEFIPVKKRMLIGFILLITLISVALEYLIPFGAWDVSVGGLENLVTNGIPAFSLKDGTFDIESPMSFDVNGAIQIKADSDVDKYKEKDLDDDYLEEILIARKNIIIKHSGGMYEVDLSKYADYTMDNQTLAELIPLIRITLAATFVIAFIITAAGYLITALFFAFLCKGRVRGKNGEKIAMGIAFAFAVFARAPFMILGDINICLGGKISDMWVMLFGVFLTIHYMFRAEMAYFGMEKPKKNIEE